jgi:Uma2 family endonuclease
MSVGQRSGVWRRRWTRKEFYRLLDLNFFLGQRVELIEGEILVKAAQKNFHAVSIALADDVLRAAFGRGYWVRVQGSLDLTPFSTPDPDLAVIAGNVRDNTSVDNPTTALQIVEVSLTTLRYDRGRKASLYARAGITDYWIVNLVGRQLEIHRDPVPDCSKKYGYGYAHVTVLQPADVASPLALPTAQIKVADLLP